MDCSKYFVPKRKIPTVLMPVANPFRLVRSYISVLFHQSGPKAWSCHVLRKGLLIQLACVVDAWSRASGAGRRQLGDVGRGREERDIATIAVPRILSYVVHSGPQPDLSHSSSWGSCINSKASRSFIDITG